MKNSNKIELWQDKMVTYAYAILPGNDIGRLLNPWSRDSHGQKTFLASSADKQTCNYDTECSDYIYTYILSMVFNTGGWRILWSSYGKLAWVEFEPMTTEFYSNALADNWE